MAYIKGGQGGFSSVPRLDAQRAADNANAIADNTATTARNSEATARNTEAMAAAQWLTAQLLIMNTALTAETNNLLKGIDGSLNRLQETTDTLSETARRQETLQRGQLELQQKEYELHRNHYGRIERDREVKHILYEMEKFGKHLARFPDNVARAYWAEEYLRLFAERKFSAQDLFEIADKRYFDERMAEARLLIQNLTENERASLDAYRHNIMQLGRLLRQDDAAGSLADEQPEAFSEADLLQRTPLPPNVDGRPLNRASAQRLAQILAAAEKKMVIWNRVKRRFSALLWAVAALGAVAFLGGLIAGSWSVFGPILLISFVALLVIGLSYLVFDVMANRRSLGLKVALESLGSGAVATEEQRLLEQEFGLYQLSKAKAVLKEWKLYEKAAAKFSTWYHAEVAARKARVKQHNDQVAIRNAKRAADRENRKRSREQQLTKLREWVKRFLQSHPDILGRPAV